MPSQQAQQSGFQVLPKNSTTTTSSAILNNNNTSSTTTTTTTTTASTTVNNNNHYNNTKQKRLKELRVAKQELTSGDTSGRIFVRLSPGSVAFLKERNIVQARIDRLLYQTIEEIDSEEKNKNKYGQAKNEK